MSKLQKHELQDLLDLIKIGKKYLWRGHLVKEFLEKNGLHLTRGNFYSPISTNQEVSTSWELADDGWPYLEPELYHAESMRRFLQDELLPFARDFDPPIEKQEDPRQFYWKNSAFSYADAMAYYCMIRTVKPATIIEIGSGYSTLVALQALKDNKKGRLILIEPFPMAFLKGHRDLELIVSPVQDVPLSFFNNRLSDGDMLFIDSTHTVKAGGDCLYIYLKLLPLLRADIVVHAHDVHLPGMIPKSWVLKTHQHWMEQYLLQAYLLENERVDVLFSACYNRSFNRELLEKLMGGKYPATGASFWFRLRPREHDFLMSWLEELDLAITVLLESRRWKIGNAIGSFVAKALGRLPVPMPVDHIYSVLSKYRAWRAKRRGTVAS